jgi:hypothetical protein
VEKFLLTKQSRAATEKDAGLKEILNHGYATLSKFWKPIPQ